MSLIDIDGTTGLAYITGTGLQFQSPIGTADLQIEPGEHPPVTVGYVLTQTQGYVFLEDGFSRIILNG